MLNKEAIDYVEGIDVPAFDVRAVRSRQVEPVRSYTWRQGAIAAAAFAVVVSFIFSGPAVLAQVERTLRAFVSTGGQMQAVPVESLTLDRARASVPFTVIAPGAIPAGFTGTVDEIDPGPSRFDSRLVFRFSNGTGPGFTIVESSAMQAGMKQHLWMTEGKGGMLPRLPGLPPASTGRHAFVEFRGNSVTRRVSIEPISWTVAGTHIDLVSPPGLLTKAQIEAIRRSML
jgi:hypothetical protein